MAELRIEYVGYVEIPDAEWDRSKEDDLMAAASVKLPQQVGLNLPVEYGGYVVLEPNDCEVTG